MEVTIDIDFLNALVDSDQLSNTELGYLLKLIGLLERNSLRLAPVNRGEMCVAMNASQSSGRKALSALEGAGMLQYRSGDYYLSSELIVGGER